MSDDVRSFNNGGMTIVVKLINTILNAVFPRMCPVCGEITTNGNFHKICEKIFAPPSGIRCKKCGKGMKSLSEPICSDCKDRDHLYDRHISAFEYNEFLKKEQYTSSNMKTRNGLRIHLQRKCGRNAVRK